MNTTTITTDWTLLEDIYSSLQMGQGITDEDEAVDPSEIDGYDYDEARDEAARNLATATDHYERYPDLAVFLTLAEEGLLDGHEIWEQINQATADGIRHMAENRWVEYQDSLEDEDGEDW